MIVERTTPGGLIIDSECLASHTVGNAVWTLWRDSFAGSPLATWINLEVVIAGRKLTFREGAGLTRVDCPLEFLEQSRVVDRDWRDRVWKWREQTETAL